MNFLSFLLISLCLSPFAFAEEPKVEEPKESYIEKAGQVLSDTKDKVSNSLDKVRARRANTQYLILGNFSYLDLIIPGKTGLTVGKIENADITWELEYLKGSIAVPFLIKDLGEMSDERFSLIRRNYKKNNSFNVSYGISYFDFSVHIGDKLLSRVTGGSYPNIDLTEIQSLGFNMAIGNRWTFSRNFTLGVDWISWAQPVFLLKRESVFLDHATDADDRRDAERGVKAISYFPRLAFFKLQLGISF